MKPRYGIYGFVLIVVGGGAAAAGLSSYLIFQICGPMEELLYFGLAGFLVFGLGIAIVLRPSKSNKNTKII